MTVRPKAEGLLGGWLCSGVEGSLRFSRACLCRRPWPWLPPCDKRPAARYKDTAHCTWEFLPCFQAERELLLPLHLRSPWLGVSWALLLPPTCSAFVPTTCLFDPVLTTLRKKNQFLVLFSYCRSNYILLLNQKNEVRRKLESVLM